MRAVLRWAQADLRTHRGQALTIVLASAGVTVALLMSVALLVAAAHPWQRLFTATHGAHVWMRVDPGADTAALRRLDTVTGIAGPFPTVTVTVQHGAEKAAVGLRAAESRPPSVGRPEIVSGGWLNTAGTVPYEVPSGGSRAGGTGGTPSVARSSDGASSATVNSASGAGTSGSGEPSSAAVPIGSPGSRSAGSSGTAPFGPQAPVDIVLEQSVATALWASPGDMLTARDGDRTLQLRVAGVADTAEAHYSPGGSPGIVWAPAAFVGDLAARTHQSTLTVGLVTSDPGDTRYLVQQAVAAVGPDKVVSVSTWRDARADAEGDNHLLGLLTGIFGLGALLAAAVTATGGIGVRVRAHARDVSVLKAIGLTPLQVAGMFLIQHLLLAGAGVLAALTATEGLGTRVPGPLGQALAVWQTLPSQSWALPLTALATLAVIGTGTALAGWRAARLPAIPAARAAVPGRRRLSGATRTALRLRVPPSLVLGWRAVANRPGRSAAAAARLMVPVLMISAALGTWATLDAFQHQPVRYGLAGQLTARAGTDPARVAQQLAHVPGVAAARPEVELAALAPGQTETVTLRGVGTAAHPYRYAIVDGRAPTAPDEAVAGQGLFTALNVSVGQWIRLTVGGTPHILHLVGRCIETQNGGRVVSTGFDTLQDQDPTLRPASYDLQLAPGISPSAEQTALGTATGGTVEIHRFTDPVASEFPPMRRVLIGLGMVLALVVLAEMSTSIATVIRDHTHDLRAYRAVGLTPLQTVATMVTGNALLALAAAGTGTLLGVLVSRFLVDLEGAASGVGTGIARTPSLAVLLALVAATVVLAAAACLLPALRAARTAARGAGEA